MTDFIHMDYWSSARRRRLLIVHKESAGAQKETVCRNRESLLFLHTYHTDPARRWRICANTLENFRNVFVQIRWKIPGTYLCKYVGKFHESICANTLKSAGHLRKHVQFVRTNTSLILRAEWETTYRKQTRAWARSKRLLACTRQRWIILTKNTHDPTWRKRLFIVNKKSMGALNETANLYKRASTSPARKTLSVMFFVQEKYFLHERSV